MAALNFTPKANPRVCLQNANYLPIVNRGARGVVLLQDNLIEPKLVKMRGKVLRYASTVVTNSIPMIDLDAANHFVWQPFPISDHFIQAESTFANQVGYFGNDSDEMFAEAVASNRLDLLPSKTLLNMRLTASILEEEWENLLIQELRKSFYPDLDESRTISERIIRKLHSPKLVGGFA